MIAWMLYSLLVALFVAGAARATDWLARLLGYRVRWIWAGALALTLSLSALAALRQRNGPVVDATLYAAGISAPKRAAGDRSWLQMLSARLEGLRLELEAPWHAVVSAERRLMPGVADAYALAVAVVASCALGLVLLGVGRRFRRARLAWPVVAMEGTDVRVAPRLGPIVIGVWRPEIVVPRWLLARDGDARRLVVGHEREHVRARDPLLLGLGWGAAVLAPWNPAIWYMLSRLRLAIELDCDARVLRRGATPRSYGSLLIDVAQLASPLSLSALALADDSSHLYQRILAMKPSVPRFARLRGGLAAACALAALLVACQATLPTDAQIEKMDATTATKAARELMLVKHTDTAVAYTIDGVRATAEEAANLSADKIASLEVIKSDGRQGRINVLTNRIDQLGKPKYEIKSDSHDSLRVALLKDGTAGPGEPSRAKIALSSESKSTFTGVILINGVTATQAQVTALDRNKIADVEVIKGATARRLYGDAAENGVIKITTKP